MNVDENVTAGEAEFSLIGNKLLKRRVLRAWLNVGVDFMEPLSKGRLFRIVRPVTDKDLSLNGFCLQMVSREGNYP